MSNSSEKKISAFLINDTLNQERDYKAAIQKQIEQEELNYKAAMQQDKTFDEVKAIRDKIKYLKSLLK